MRYAIWNRSRENKEISPFTAKLQGNIQLREARARERFVSWRYFTTETERKKCKRNHSLKEFRVWLRWMRETAFLFVNSRRYATREIL